MLEAFRLRLPFVVHDTALYRALVMCIAFLLKHVSEEPVIECIMKCLRRVCEECASVAQSIVWAVRRVLSRTWSVALCAAPCLHLFLADRVRAGCSQAVKACMCVLLNTLKHYGTLRTRGQSMLQALVPHVPSLESLPRVDISCLFSRASLASWVALHDATSSHLVAGRLGPLVYGRNHGSVHAHAVGALDLAWRVPDQLAITVENCGLVLSMIKLELVGLAGAYVANDADKLQCARRDHKDVNVLRRTVQLLNEQDGPAIVALSALISTCVHMASDTFDDGWYTVRV